MLENSPGGKNLLLPQLNSTSQRIYDGQFRTPVVNMICGGLPGKLLAEDKFIEIKFYGAYTKSAGEPCCMVPDI